ncbi:hypothetical protein ACJX0J_030842, partial [Zea mays]
HNLLSFLTTQKAANVVFSGIVLCIGDTKTCAKEDGLASTTLTYKAREKLVGMLHHLRRYLRVLICAVKGIFRKNRITEEVLIILTCVACSFGIPLGTKNE